MMVKNIKEARNYMLPACNNQRMNGNSCSMHSPAQKDSNVSVNPFHNASRKRDARGLHQNLGKKNFWPNKEMS